MLWRSARVNPAQERATGEYLGILSDDVAHLQNLYLRVVFPACIAYLLAIGVAVLFGFFSLPFALVILLSFAVLVVLLPMSCLLATRMVAQRAKALKADEYERLADDVYGALDWVHAGRGQAAIGLHAVEGVAIRAFEAKVRMTQRVFSLGATLLLAVVLCAVIVWAGVSFGKDGANVNWIAAFALGFFPIIESFALLPTAFSEATSHRDSIRRLDAYLSPRDRVQNPKVPEVVIPPQGISGNTANCIEFDEVSYAYPGTARLALDSLSIDIEGGESVAVLGRSGSGKSTFARLLCGSLAPDAGTVRLMGTDVGKGADLSRVVGFVGQTPYLFNRTLRDNLTLGVIEADDAMLIDVLRAVGLGEKLAAMDNGLDTVTGETGVGFSGGEAHRIAIARVLVADTPIVVVDEPFSVLDPETERSLLDTLLRACEGRTLIVITHHLAQIERFDRVVFIEDGCLNLSGSPSELLKSSPRFRDLVEFDRA